MKNLYKKQNVFICRHEAHNGFQSKMSVFHILKEKKCFPHGCVYYKWKCKSMNKGKACYRGYQYVGKNCPGCRYFYEETVHCYPQLVLDQQKYPAFLNEFKQFEEWLQDHQGREWEIHGRIYGIKPRFEKTLFPRAERLTFRGFLLIFHGLYLERTHIQDLVYAHISPLTQENLKFGKGDTLTARATLTTDRGRLILKKLRRIDIEQRGEPAEWSRSRALVARETATSFPYQPQGCIQCPFGALVDVTDLRNGDNHFRELFCLKGIQDPRGCHIRALYKHLDEEVDDEASAACLTQRVKTHS